MRLFVFALVFIAAAFFGACSSLRSVERAPSAAYYVDPQFHEFQTLMNEALSFRAKALQFAQRKKLGETSSISLTREEGDYLRIEGARYLEIRRKLLAMSLKEGELFKLPSEVKLNPRQGTRIETRNAAIYGSVTDAKISYIDPVDPQGQRSFFRIQMALAAGLLLMDNYIVAISPYNDNSSLRYVLNYDPEQKRTLQEIADSYASLGNRQQLSKSIEFVDKAMAWRRAQDIKTGPEETYLYTMIQSSLWYLSVKNGEGGGGFIDAVTNLWNRVTLRGKRAARVVSYGLSMGFGNMVGMYEERKGYLYNMPESEKASLIAEMKPLDIIMEKTPFRLTDRFIPGHYGHVAIWLGTEDQLRELKVWDQIPPRIQAKIRTGHRIVEALRPGVELNTLEHFLNIDDFLVVRDIRPNINDEYRRNAILQAVAQIGKEYDFNFDVHTHERIVCSEIAYVVYKDIKWPLEETIRRYTISPDNVAQFAVGNNRYFEPVIMYYNGKRYYKDLTHSLTLLLKADENSYAEFAQFHAK